MLRKSGKMFSRVPSSGSDCHNGREIEVRRMATIDELQPDERCISCGRLIAVSEASRHLHGFPIHVTCYERELGIPKQSKSSDNDDDDDDC